MCMGGDMLAAGGFNGELAVQRLGCPEMMFCGRISSSDNGITNGLEVVTPEAAPPYLVSANNDNKVGGAGPGAHIAPSGRAGSGRVGSGAGSGRERHGRPPPPL
jgi:hypothetical protein